MLIFLPAKYKVAVYESNCINFAYELHDNDYITVLNDGDSFDIPIIRYEETKKLKIFESRVKYLVIEGKNKFLRETKKQQNEAFLSGEQGLSQYDEIAQCCLENILNLQIFFNTNVFYIEDDKEMVVLASQIATSLAQFKEKPPQQRTKGGAKSSEDLLSSLLQDIPGISKEIANTLASKYKNISKISAHLKSDKEVKTAEISNIEVEYKNTKRKIGLTRANDIVEYFINKI